MFTFESSWDTACQHISTPFLLHVNVACTFERTRKRCESILLQTKAGKTAIVHTSSLKSNMVVGATRKKKKLEKKVYILRLRSTNCQLPSTDISESIYRQRSEIKIFWMFDMRSNLDGSQAKFQYVTT